MKSQYVPRSAKEIFEKEPSIEVKQLKEKVHIWMENLLCNPNDRKENVQVLLDDLKISFRQEKVNCQIHNKDKKWSGKTPEGKQGSFSVFSPKKSISVETPKKTSKLPSFSLNQSPEDQVQTSFSFGKGKEFLCSLKGDSISIRPQVSGTYMGDLTHLMPSMSQPVTADVSPHDFTQAIGQDPDNFQGAPSKLSFSREALFSQH